ncbi:DNA mismatch repair protein MSH6 protein [Dioscorea alata]|uniref:DNA mismatch repair protein MSH6 protein n=1 Tax=Dioscorea alata TaxID=55571 RepID=A0ACB7UAR3_DIOAL|nr:DNA mismatch repair protein MSH6 protein [Dioscorea alata]
MQRQRSILSFLQRPSLDLHGGEEEQQRSALPGDFPAKELFPEVRGTDTPPEKLRRPFILGGDQAPAADGSRQPRSIASIMHKFSREDRSRISDMGNLDESDSATLHTRSNNEKRENLTSNPQVPCDLMFNEHTRSDFLLQEMESDIPGPETPAMRPLFPRLKRIHEEPCHLEFIRDSPPLSSSKRVKSVLDEGLGKGTHVNIVDLQGNRSKLVTTSSANHVDGHCNRDSLILSSQKRLKASGNLSTGKETSAGVSEAVNSKFEWLNPSSIRDANRRRPNDPLFDKRTLYIPPDEMKKMSASQKQYWTVKCQYMDIVLFFKVGKFYELYELDAEIGQKELDWKMTVSGVGKCRQVGISEAGIDDAVEKLTARGYKVGRMEQLETSEQAKARGASSVIQRKLVHVSTPSTVTDGSMGPDAVHLLAIKEGNGRMENGSIIYAFAFLDYAALKVWVGSLCDDASCAALGALVMQVSPREIIYESEGLSKETLKALTKYASAGSTRTQLTPVTLGPEFLDASSVRKSIHSKGYFKGSSKPWSSAFDFTADPDIVLCALGGLLGHMCRMMLGDALRNGELLSYHVYKSCLRMDGQTLVNLEIFGNNADGGPSGTLFKYLDHCTTSSGKRLLKRWICHPLKDIEDINDRLNVVEGLIKNSGISSVISEYLRRLPDIERLLGRVKASIGASSTLLLPFIGEKLLKQRIKTFGSLIRGLRVGIDLLLILQREDHGILSLPKFASVPTLNELDELLNQFEAAMEDDFPNYQDHNIKESDAKTLAVLVELFSVRVTDWSQVIHALNCVDVLQSFATIATVSCGTTCRPVFLPAETCSKASSNGRGDRGEGSPVLHMKGLWHPYAIGENGNSPVPNDVCLGEDEVSGASYPCSLLLTGPNMGGKSTLLRATCLAVILAQLGCYVPCETCVLSPADIIFTRLGATDRIMSGESTFFVECSETASVLQNATCDSIVLLDELGRGTSTFDGYAIAYAVFRHLVEKVGCRLLFATHYHPLTKEFACHPRVNLQHMACMFNLKPNSTDGQEKNLVFLYRLASGACPESYGLQVALMAGVSRPIVDAASDAAQRMKTIISKNFKSSEGRCKFSSLHEGWMKTLLALSGSASDGCWDEDASDTLLCLWLELKNFYSKRPRVHVAM